MFRERLQALRNTDTESVNVVNSNDSIVSETKSKVIETESFESFLNNKIVNMYARPWNKLETRLKIIKVKEYYNRLCDEGEISKAEVGEKIKRVEGLVKYNRLKSSEVKYDPEDCMIIEIK
jgi:hypothetical protein